MPPRKTNRKSKTEISEKKPITPTPEPEITPQVAAEPESNPVAPTATAAEIPAQPAARTQMNPVPIAMAIVIAGALIGGGIFLGAFYSGDKSSGTNNPAVVSQQPAGPDLTAAKSTPQVSADDHIRGSLDAEIFLVEYSDLDCPFCQDIHGVFQQITEQYDETEVAWVYRHLPLTSLHPYAADKAAIAECVAELGGNDAFWEFTDTYFERQNAREGAELAVDIAAELGLNRSQIESCLESGKYEDKITASTNEAFAAGAQGTPHTVVISGDEYLPVFGSKPVATFTSMIEQLLSR